MRRFCFNWLWFLLLLMTLTGCSEQNDTEVGSAPRDLTRNEVCMIDGMILLDYPGPKGQLFFKNGEAHFFCDINDLFTILFDPDYKVKIKHVYVQDVGGRPWGSYSDRWVDVNQAFLVMDSDMFGAMGPTIATFAVRAEAEAFAAEHGGTVLTYAELDQARWEAYLKRVREQLRALTDLSLSNGEPDEGGDGQQPGIRSHDE